MGYNWEKIFKSKSDKELFLIYNGKRNLGKDAEQLAKKELLARNFDFDNLDREKNKWELEKLIEEEKEDQRKGIPFLGYKAFLLIGYVGLVLIVLFVLDLFFDFINKEGESVFMGQIFPILIAVFFSISGFSNYYRITKRETFRKKRMMEIIRDL